jgi:hypothetical protein
MPLFAIMVYLYAKSFKKEQPVELCIDMNQVIRKGMKGVILQNEDGNNVLVKFVKEDDSDYQYHFTYTVDKSKIKPTKN